MKQVTGTGGNSPRWWQSGSVEKKPSYFRKFNLKDVTTNRQRQAGQFYANEQKQIDYRNAFYKNNKDMTSAPKYSYTEALQLYGQGYTGVFGRSKSGQTLSLLGQPWQQAYALDRLRHNKKMLEYQVVTTGANDANEREAYKELSAADRTAKTWTGVFDLMKDYNKIGGEEGYKRKYGDGDTPKPEGSKYSLFYNINNRATKRDDIQSTYQSNLSAALNKASKQFAQMAADAEDDNTKQTLSSIATSYATLAEDGKIKTNEKSGKPNKDKIGAMEAAIKGMPTTSKALQDLIGTPSATYSKGALQATLGVIGGPIYGQAVTALLGTDAGKSVANNVMGRMQAIQSGPTLQMKKPDWGSFLGIPDVTANAIRGVTQFGIGLVPGMAMMADEGIKALDESVKAPKQAVAGLIGATAAVGTAGIISQDAVTNKVLDKIGTDKYDWGSRVDFQLGDAIWSDFAQRYYDPFAYKTDKDGKQEFRGFWSGLTSPEDWKDLGNSVGQNPVAYVLDVLDLMPVVGWAAKGASAASVASKAGRFAGTRFKIAGEVAKAEAARAGKAAEFAEAESAVRGRAAGIDMNLGDLTMAEKGEWKAAWDSWHSNGRVGEPPRLSEFAGARILREQATDVLDAVRKNPDLLEILDEAQIREAADMIGDLNKVDDAKAALTEADAAVLEAKARYDQIPSVRTFRKVARKALTGDASAVRQMDRWKAMGYEFNGAENTRALRFSAKFEERTKVLDPSDPNVVNSGLAVVRLPASPLARGIKEGVYWVGRTLVDPALQSVDAKAQRVASKTGFESLGKVTSKMVDMPLLGYRWNYTRAIEQSLADNFGDSASELRFAADTYRLQAQANLAPETQAALLSELYGGAGEVATNAPILRRQAILDKLDEITDGQFLMDNDFNIKSNFIKGTEDQAEALITEYRKLLNTEVDDLNQAAKSFDTGYASRREDIRRRLLDDSYNPDDVELGQAVEIYRRMVAFREKIANRIVHTDTTPHNIQYLENLYTEAMNALRITEKQLFGEDNVSGRLSAWTDNVVMLNDGIQPLLNELFELTDDNIIEFAQKPRSEGTVWDALSDEEATRLQDEWVRFIRKMTEDGDGLFRRGDVGPNDIANPVAVRAKNQSGVIKGFTRVHLPSLKVSINKGRVSPGRLIDTNESFIIPNEFLITRKTAKGNNRVPVTLATDTARKQFYTGALNSMSDVFPSARFYSEKVSESGLRGTRENEKMIKNEHVVATTGLREHSVALAVKSEVLHYTHRLQDQIMRQAEGQAVLLPAEQVVGKSASESGYHILSLVRGFDDIETARAFAKARNVEREFDDALAAGPQRVNSVTDINPGLAIMNIDGVDKFMVRGTIDDWAKYSGSEDLKSHSIMQDYKSRVYDDPDNVATQGYVLAVPDIVDRKLSLMVIQGNTYANRLLENPLAKYPTNFFKRIVLNFRPGFIESNVIGGTAMLMMRNPMAASKILARFIAKNAQLRGDKFVSEFAGNSAAVDRHLAMEIDGNVYKNDSGVAALSRDPSSVTDLKAGGASGLFKKYIWNGGYTTVAAFERMVRNAVAIDFLTQDPVFRAFMDGPEVKRMIDNGVDYYGQPRPKEGANPITKFEAASDLLLDRTSPFFDDALKNRMRYTTNTVSGNYHRFNAFEQLLRNFLMPFYAWQRHSLAYTWRMAVDKPITATALYHIGQAGYNQVAEQGVPDYLRQTIPVPEVLKARLGILPEDFRIDASSINPFGATTEMTGALYRLISGDSLGGSAESIFKFTNPYLNSLIKDTLGVDPVTGRIDWERLSAKDSENGRGVLGSTTDMFKNIGKSTYAGSFMKAKDVIDNDYENDALGNLYPAIESQDDALKVLEDMYTIDANGNPVSRGLKGWSLKIPSMRSAEQRNRAVDAFGVFGVKSAVLNQDVLDLQARDEYVASMALAYYNNKDMANAAASDIRRIRTWEQNRKYIEEYWAPRARKAGVPEALIQIGLLKIQKQKPKGVSNIDPNLLLATMGG